MKHLTIDEWIPGGEGHKVFAPFSWKEIFFTSHYCILNLEKGLLLLHKHLTNTSQSLDEYKKKHFIAHDRLPLCEALKNSPTLYHAEEKEGSLQLYFYKKGAFCALSSSIEGEYTLLWEKQFNEPISFPKANSQGDLLFNSENKILLINHHGEISTLYEEMSETWRINTTPSRNELGIDDLFYWSPDHQKVAFYRTDDSQVTSYPLVHIKDPIAQVEMIKYPMAGTTSEQVSIGLLDLSTRQCTFIHTMNDPQGIDSTRSMNHQESYLTSLSWSTDSQHLLLCELERSQQYYQAKQYNATDGSFEQLLFTESSDTYTEPQHPFLFINEHQFVYQSRQSGYNHIYEYDITTHTRRAITSGCWEVTHLCGYDSKSNQLYYQSTENSPLQRDGFVIELETLHKESFTNQGFSRIAMNLEATEWLCHTSSRSTPGELALHTPEGTFTLLLSNPYEGYTIPKQIVGEFIREVDQQRFFYRVTLPNQPIHEPLPVLFYVYGGPHVQLITQQWASQTKGLEEMMADAGYAVFCIDPRGSDNRGHAFESAIYQQINRRQIEDYDYALDWFFSHFSDVADPQRMFIYGWSFGGCMTISMLLHSKHTFLMGIAGGAVVNWRFYEVMYTERYMGHPNNNSDGYDWCDLRNHLHQLHTPLHLIHCDNDPVVLWQNTLSLVQKAHQETKNGELIHYTIFPGHAHNVQGVERVELMKKLKSLIDNQLKRCPRA